MTDLIVTLLIAAMFYCLLVAFLPIVKATITLISNAVKVFKLVVFDK